jgi:hypothetical protein
MEATIAGPTPVAPAFGTTLCRLVLKELLCRLEVGQEVVVWLYGDDLAVLRPDLLEQFWVIVMADQSRARPGSQDLALASRSARWNARVT